MDSVDTEPFRTLDPNSNLENGMDKIGKTVKEYAGQEQGPSLQGISPVVASPDPLMRQAAAGLTLPDFDQSPRQYKMASDIFGTGMDKSWTASPHRNESSTRSNVSQSPVPGNQTPYSSGLGSFKITEFFPSTAVGSDEVAGNSTAGRRARESSGNPLTGQGFNQENTKTGKRYFEGSNANQKLW